MSITAELTARVSVSGVSEATSQLNRMGESTNKAGGFLKGLAGHMLGMAGGIGIANLASNAFGFLKDQLGSVFQESMDAQAGMALTNAVLKSTHGISGMTAQAVADLAGNLSHVTMFSDDTTQAAENMLLTFTNIGKNVFPQATKTVLDMSQALGQDTKNSAIQLGKALNDPVAGITALQRVGVTFSSTQKDLIKHFMDTNNIAGAQGVILKELQKEFGGSAEAAGKTFGGQMKILGQRMDDIKQNIGDALLPMVMKLANWISANVVPALQRFSDWFVKNGVPALTKFGDIVGKIVDYVSHFSEHANVLIPILAGLGAVLLAVVVPAVIALAAGVLAATWPALAIGVAVAALVAIFMHFYQTNAGFKGFIDNMVAGFKVLASVVGTVLGSITNDTEKMRLAHEQKLTSMRIKTDTETAKMAQVSIANLEKQRVGLLKKLSETTDPMERKQIEHELKMNEIQLKHQAVRLQQAEADKVKQLAKQKVLHDQMLEAQKWFGQRFLDMVGKWIGDQMSKLGTMVRGWLDHLGQLKDKVLSSIGTTIQLFLTALGNMKDKAISKAIDMVTSFVSTIAGIPGKLGGLANQLITAGATIVYNIASGIVGAIAGAIGDAMSQVGTFISQHLPSSPAKRGPLRDLQKQGAGIPQQVALGIGAGQHHLESMLSSLLSPIAASASLSLSVAGSAGSLGSAASLSPGISSYSFRPASGGQPVINITVQSPDINMDGVRLSRKLLPHLKNALDYNT